jgi:hypothetical protein
MQLTDHRHLVLLLPDQVVDCIYLWGPLFLSPLYHGIPTIFDSIFVPALLRANCCEEQSWDLLLPDSLHVLDFAG